MEILNRYEFTLKAENEFGVFGNAHYFGTDIYISKATKQIYQVDYGFDVYAVIVDPGYVYKADKIEEDCTYNIPIFMWCCDDMQPNELIRFISSEINKYEENNTQYFINEFKNRKKYELESKGESTMETNNLFRKIYIYETYGPSEIFLTDATDFELECIVAQIAQDIENGNGSDIKKMLYDIDREYVQLFNSEDHCCNVSEMVQSVGYDKEFDLCDYYNSDFEHTPYQMADILMDSIKDMSDSDYDIAEEKPYVAKLFKKLMDDEDFEILAHHLDILFMSLKEN